MSLFASSNLTGCTGKTTIRSLCNLPQKHSRRKNVANHKSALKRNRQNAVRAARNTHVRSTMRTLVKNVRDAAAAGEKDVAMEALKKAAPYIDKTANKGVIHKATASRKISRLTKLVNSIG